MPKKAIKKKYIRKTKVSKEDLLGEPKVLLEIINSLNLYPAPLFQIFLEDQNNDLFELLTGTSDTPEFLNDCLNQLKKNESKLTGGNLDSWRFLEKIQETSQVFSIELDNTYYDNFQLYIGTILKFLFTIKFSLIYQERCKSFAEKLKELISDTQELFSDEDYKKIEAEILSSFNLEDYEKFLSNKFSIEESFDLTELIKLLDDENVGELSLNLNQFDANLDIDDKEIFLKFIDLHINPRINLIKESLRIILEKRIKFLEDQESTEFNILNPPFNELYVFSQKIARYVKSGIWKIEQLKASIADEEDENSENASEAIEEEQNGNNQVLEKTDNTNDLNDEDIDESLFSDLKESNPFRTFYDSVKTSFHVDSMDSVDCTDYSAYINIQFLKNQIPLVDSKLKKILLEDLESTMNNHGKIVENQDLPMIIPINLKYTGQFKNLKKDKVENLLGVLEKNIYKIESILSHESFKKWFQGRIITQYCIKPLNSYLKTINYLKTKFDTKIFLNKKFAKHPLISNFLDTKKQSGNLIISEYLKTLYEDFDNSELFFKYRIIFDDFQELNDNCRLLTSEIHKNIEKLFRQSDIPSIEEKEIILNIFNSNPINFESPTHQQAIEKLIELKIISKITTFTIGNV